MLAEFSTALTSLNAIAEIAKGMVGVRDAAMIQAKASELLAQVISTQQSAAAAVAAQLALLEEVRALKEKVRSLEAWEAQKQRYELKNFGGNTFAYALKPAMRNGETEHRACANCYQKGQISPLQFDGEIAGQDQYFCPACDKKFRFGERNSASPIHYKYGPP